ncbi:MAG: glycosyltransferase, partial [Lachnospiraceae bacterium]|nr:glycosyltransferase [Lachnospiraceae bacterium]
MSRTEEEKPLISVIVPVFNGQDYLEKCIESIEKQTYKNLEIIIINDGSTDDTAAVCVKLRENYENIHVITTEDEGVSAARNAGIEAAKGEFLTFVDADDRLRPKTLKVLYNCIM